MEAVNTGVSATLGNSGDKKDETYEIFIDPFKGSPMKSNSHGRKRSPKISADSPVGVEYKYSIVGDDCTVPALDPRFLLD